MTAVLEKIRRIVELYRDGSGSHVVSPLSPRWIELMQKIARFNYGRLTIVVQTDTSTDGGYDGYPGCELLIYPGNTKGRLELLDDAGKESPDSRQPTPESQANDFDRGNCLCIRTGYSNLRQLHESIGEMLRNMEARRKHSH